MKLIQAYSRSASVDIKDKPFLYEQFISPPCEKYITLQSNSGMPAKNYSYFDLVINIIKPLLDKENISIIHLGDKNTQPLANCINVLGVCNINQSNYLISRALLHLGVDSCLSHIAGAADIPLVSLYGSTSVANHSPYFYNKDKTIFLESHRNGNNPTFAREECPKTIDFINPEDIAAAVLKLLNINYNYEFKTVYFGDTFKNRVIEAVPDSLINNKALGVDSLIIRMDFKYNLEILKQQLQICNCSIVTDRPIDLETLKNFAPRITQIFFCFDRNTFSLQFIKDMIGCGIRFGIFSYESEEFINSLKIQTYEHCILFKKSTPKLEDLKEFKDKKLDNLYYKSNKITLSSNKFYPSKSAWLKGENINSLDCPIVKFDNNIENLREIEYFWIVEKTS